MRNPWFWFFLILAIGAVGGGYYQYRANASKITPRTISPESHIELIAVTSTPAVSLDAFAEQDGVMQKFLAKSSDGLLYVYGFGSCKGSFSVGVVEFSERGMRYPLLLDLGDGLPANLIGDAFVDTGGVIEMTVTSTLAERGCRLSVMKR